MTVKRPLHLVDTETRPVAVSVWRRARALVHSTGILTAVHAWLHSNVGAPRILSAEALLTLFAVKGIAKERMLLTEMMPILRGLTRYQRDDIGLPEFRESYYRMVTGTLDRLTAALNDKGLPVPGENRHMGLDEFCTRICGGSIPENHILAGPVAIDSTDYETWARRRSWASKIDVDPDSIPVPDSVKPPKQFVNERGWPIKGDDGRWQHTADPTARDGWRSGRNGKRSEIYCGYDLHLAVNIREVGADEVPHVIRSMRLSPGGGHKATAGMACIDVLRDLDYTIPDVAADRGYSYCRPETWAIPLRERGIANVFDLHGNQRGPHPHDKPGTLWLDGGLFSTALPNRLRKLSGFRPGMTSTDRQALHAAYDERARYAFRPLAKPDHDGYQRFKGPALAGSVRCPNHGPSMRRPHDLPLTQCTPGTPCGCAVTLTISPDTHPGLRQRTLYGTTAWGRDYYRRNGVESGNSEITTHRLTLGRGFTRVFGTTKNAILLAFAIAGVNINILRGWHAKRSLPDPWAIALGEPTELKHRTTTKLKKKRARRRTITTAGGAPPGP